jgi:hypothetical protein
MRRSAVAVCPASNAALAAARAGRPTALPRRAGVAGALAVSEGLTDSARHVTGCRSTEETMAQNALDDVAAGKCLADVAAAS